ncbi:hypothetical protein H8D29_06820 [PVC group bacterium]|nr:hypothetical protein [PVC group bacterium]
MSFKFGYSEGYLIDPLFRGIRFVLLKFLISSPACCWGTAWAALMDLRG